jgi:asparagine synthase (glutamine-hydrolysing)
MNPPGGEDGGMRFCSVKSEGFEGGYYLHDRLPLTERDIYYADSKTDILVLFSGYIYNKKDLCSAFGFDAADPEPVIAAGMFLREGPGFVAKLNGDFSVFICRPAGRKAWLFRDHAGIRPLAWSLREGQLYFSSDFRELSRLMADGRGPDTTWLTCYFRYTDLTMTPCREVNKLLPGHYLEYSGGSVCITKYWDPGKIRTDRRMSYETMLAELSNLVSDAVSIRCDSRFTAAAHVSSGIDSGMVATLARRGYSSQSPFYGYSWSPAAFTARQIPYDERDMVRSLCVASGITPVFSQITPGQFLENTGRLFYNGGFFIEENLARQASESGANLIFSGWGGDEFISTGDRGIETDLLRRLRLKVYFQRNPVRPLKRFVKYFLEYTLFPVLGVLYPKIARSFASDARYIKKPWRKSEKRVLRNFYFHTSRRQMHLRYLRFYHLQERCETWTIMGYREGVEYRYPLLDRRIIEYMVRVPSEHLCRTGLFRPLLRVIGEGIIPDEIRLNTGKKDHLYSAWWEELMVYSARSVIGEATSWKNNPDLGFIDFDLLEADMENYRSDPAGVDVRALFRALVYLRAVHHFSLEYRRRNDGTGE